MDSDEYSDLTDLDDDDEYKVSGSKSRKSTSKVAPGAGYRIRNALKVPRATTYTAQALYDQIHNSDIDLEPEYQRAVVWPESKQIGIVDSIFRNFYIPPVIFAVKQYEDGSESKTCIDGKQRLTSIHRFMDGLIPHKDRHTGEKLWYKDVQIPGKGNKGKKILPEKYRRLFANKQIVCVEYADINDDDEREIFQRVQLGMALTPAEKLQVINTQRATFVRELLLQFVNDNNGLGGDALNWERTRGADFRCVAQSVFCIVRYPSGIRNAGTMPQLEKWLASTDPLPLTTMDMIKETFRVFVQLVSDKQLNKVFHKPEKIAPLEFICIPILIAMKRESMTPAQLAATIGRMREDVRNVHDDIRMNDRVSKTMLNFIASIQGPTAIVPEHAAAASVGDKRKRAKDDETSTSDGSGPGPSKAHKAKAKAKPKASPAAAKSSTSASSMTATIPGPDRMAALRTAKGMVQQQNAPSSPKLPSLPSTPSLPRPPFPPGSASSSQQSFQFSQNPPGGSSTVPTIPTLPRRPPAPSVDPPPLGNGLEAQLMASMNRPAVDRHRPGSSGGNPASSGGRPPTGDGRSIDPRARPKGWGA
ncbi:hypothetical protein HGRIS_010540 [Hohenbuehelia grisea]|uniref:GmrSD restriction endonucleases N-terminal domain-containing protein n=1 Tax=Hohenbuehelia grisea TaxID=104357 RepID=A0ABR3IXR4_9AGAR